MLNPKPTILRFCNGDSFHQTDVNECKGDDTCEADFAQCKKFMQDFKVRLRVLRYLQVFSACVTAFTLFIA